MIAGLCTLLMHPSRLQAMRYVRRWYADESREVTAIPNTIWQSMTQEQRAVMRFPVTPELSSARFTPCGNPL